MMILDISATRLQAIEAGMNTEWSIAALHAKCRVVILVESAQNGVEL